MDQDQEERKEDHLGSIYESARNRLLARLLTRGIASLGRAALAATSEVWIPIAIVLGAVLLFTIIILVITTSPASPGQVTETLPSPSLSPGASPNIHFYCQYDSQWTNSSCDIIHNGCDPTAIAIILASFGDRGWTPNAVALKNGIGCSGATTTNQTEAALRWVKTLGYKVSGLDPSEDNSGFLVSDGGKFNFRRAKKYINAGYLIHAGAISTFRSGGSLVRDGHSFVITDVDPSSETVTAYDPTFCFSDSDIGIRTMTKNDIGKKEGEDSWYWAFPVKKQ